MDHGGSAARWRDPATLAAVALTVAVHLLLLAVVRSEPHPPKPPGPPPIQVVWIEAAPRPQRLPVPPMPLPPSRRANDAFVDSVAAPSAAAPPLITPRDRLPSVEVPRAQLFDDNGRLRLPDSPATAASRSPDDARTIGRRTVELPGSNVPIVEVGRLREQITPEQVVLGVAQFFFGQPNPDDCSKIERRLINSEAGTVRDIDLAKWQRFCRGQH